MNLYFLIYFLATSSAITIPQAIEKFVNAPYSAIPIPQAMEKLVNASKEYQRHNLWKEGMRLHQNKPYYPTQIIFNSNINLDGYHITCFRIPSLLHTSNNNLVAFSEARINSCADCSLTGIVSRHSKDGGLTWGSLKWVVKPENINNITNSDRGANPTTLYDRYNNRLVLHFSRGGKHQINKINKINLEALQKWDCIPAFSNWQTTSEDGGITWTDPYNIGTYLNRWEGVLPGPGNGIQLDSGRYVFPGHYGTAERNYGAVITYYSDDFGKTYQTSNPLPRMDESTLAYLGEENIMINMRTDNINNNQNLRAYSLSNDSGTTWGSILYDNELPGPICQGNLAGFNNTIWFSNPDMSFARANLTLKYKTRYNLTNNWKVIRIADETILSDYSSITNTPIYFNHTPYLGILWGTCQLPLPFRLWCLSEFKWTISYTLVNISKIKL